MSKEKNHLERLIELFEDQPRIKIDENLATDKSFRDSKNVLVALVSTKCGAQTVIEYKNLTKFIAVTNNRTAINDGQLAMVFLIQFNNTTQEYRIFTALTSESMLVVDCEDSETPFNTIKPDNRLVSDARNCEICRYIATKQSGVYLRNKCTRDISSEFSFHTDKSGITMLTK